MTTPHTPRDELREVVSRSIRKYEGVEMSSEIENIAYVMEAIDTYAAEAYKKGYADRGIEELTTHKETT